MKLRRERFKGSRILFRPCVVGSKREDNARVDVIIMDAIFLSFDVKKKPPLTVPRRKEEANCFLLSWKRSMVRFSPLLLFAISCCPTDTTTTSTSNGGNFDSLQRKMDVTRSPTLGTHFPFRGRQNYFGL